MRTMNVEEHRLEAETMRVRDCYNKYYDAIDTFREHFSAGCIQRASALKLLARNAAGEKIRATEVEAALSVFKDPQHQTHKLSRGLKHHEGGKVLRALAETTVEKGQQDTACDIAADAIQGWMVTAPPRAHGSSVLEPSSMTARRHQYQYQLQHQTSDITYYCKQTAAATILGP